MILLYNSHIDIIVYITQLMRHESYQSYILHKKIRSLEFYWLKRS